jgi:hypothetical protein
MVPVLRVADGQATALVTGEHRFAPALPLYLFLERKGVELHLSEHLGDATPDTLVYFWVDDVGAIAAELSVDVNHEPCAREIELVDPDGNRLRIGTRH